MADTTTWRNYAEQGDGVHFVPSMPNTAEWGRINMLGDMNDRVKKFRGQRSRKGLLAMADEYEEKKMPRMAESLRFEAFTMKRTRRVRDKIKVTDS